jgi:hypothetical protein
MPVIYQMALFTYPHKSIGKSLYGSLSILKIMPKPNGSLAISVATSRCSPLEK